MRLIVEVMNPEIVPQFKKDIQEAFQLAFEDSGGTSDEPVLPIRDIDESLNKPHAVAYQAILDGELVGGAVIEIDPETQHNHLDFLYVKVGQQGKKIGQTIWKTIEANHSETCVWETYTPYFDRRNIHFYVNACGFQIVEFFHEGHPMPHEEGSDETDGPALDGFFRFEKRMK